MTRSSGAILTLAALSLSVACSGGNDPVDLGENTPAKTGEQLSDYAGTWDGYAEAYFFLSGSDRIRLSLDEEGNGYALLGDIPDLAAPTNDPAGGYPPAPYDGQLSTGEFAEGFRYPTHAARVSSKRMQLGLYFRDLFAEWCALQAPIMSIYDIDGVQTPAYACVPNGGSRTVGDACQVQPDGGEWIDVACSRLYLCQTYCSCTSESCATEPPSEPDSLESYRVLDGVLEDGGNRLVGSLTLANQRVTIRLERQ